MNEETRQLLVQLLRQEYTAAYLDLAGTTAQYDCSGFGWYRDSLKMALDRAVERLDRAVVAFKDINEPIPDMGY